MYRTDGQPNFKSLAAAARTGNPESIVAFNPGVSSRIMSVTPYEDYTAGEIDRIEGAVPGKRDGAQLHMLSYLGPLWGHGDAPRSSDAQITALIQKDVVLTCDVPGRMDGRIPKPFVAQLRKIAEAIKTANPSGLSARAESR